MVIASSIAVLWTGLILGSMQAVGAIDTSIFRARALATDDSSYYSSCNTEVEACRADPTCVSCVSADVTDETVAECYADVDYTGSCDNFGDALCCILSTEPDCVSNSAVDYFGCFHDEYYCPGYDYACSNGVPTTSSVSPFALTMAAGAAVLVALVAALKL